MSLQTRAHSLANCRQGFDTLIEAMNDASDNWVVPFTISCLDWIIFMATHTLSLRPILSPELSRSDA